MSTATDTLNDLHNRLIYMTEGLQAIGMMLTKDEQVEGSGSAVYSFSLALNDITERVRHLVLELEANERK